MDNNTTQNQVQQAGQGNDTEIQKFKKILDYFVMHMVYVCKEVSKNSKINNEVNIDNVPGKLKKETFTIKEGCKSGQGYAGNKIQKWMEDTAKVTNNSFPCSNFGNQRICISIDLTGGYKGGSYLHLVTINDDSQKKNE